MKKVVWKNKSNNQLCITIPKDSEIKEGDLVEIKKTKLKRIAYIGVVGDLFHYGHLQSIKFAKSISDYCICGVFTDEAVEEYRAKPITNLKERKAIIENLNCVDKVLVQSSRDPTDNLKKIHEEFPEAEVLLVHGDNWQELPGTEYIRKIGGRIVKHPYYARLSAFKIISKLMEQQGKIKDLVDFTSYIQGNKNFEKEKKDKVVIFSKANTLLKLKPLLTKSKIEELYIFTLMDWEKDKRQILNDIAKKFSPGKIVIRSSLIRENIQSDVLNETKYEEQESVLDIDSSEAERIERGIKKIIASYKLEGETGKIHQVLVQREVGEVVLKGNLFMTNDFGCVINYDEITEQGLSNNETIRIDIKQKQERPEAIQKIIMAWEELKKFAPHTKLDIDFALDKKGEVVIFKVQPLITKIVHGWGGTTSIQSLECHTLRYLQYRDRIGNAVDRSIFCEIRNNHHTVYFDEKDVSRWNKEGLKLLDKTKREEIVEQNLEQIKRFFEFYEKNKREVYSNKTNKELYTIYKELLRLVMENGSFFPYSRPEIVKPIKEKIFSLLEGKENQEELFQQLTTPVEEDLFLKEQKDRLTLRKGTGSEEEFKQYAEKHPWRFVNTYSRKKIFDFLKEEVEEIKAEELGEEIAGKIKENGLRKEEQEKIFSELNMPLLQELCGFLQRISLIRLENKKIWAGYEFLFLELFEEIAKRIGLSTEDYFYTYRIEETERFLSESKVLSYEEVKRRLEYLNMEISPEGIEISYKPKYSKELDKLPKDKKGLKGEVGNLGKVIGKALIVVDDSIDSLIRLKKEISEDNIYITTMTHPAMVSILRQAKGIITDEGGVTSHAAIISREMNIPCLVGTKIATKFFQTGEMIEVNTYSKSVRKLSENEIEEHKARAIQKEEKLEIRPLIRIPKPELDADIPYIIDLGEITKEGISYVGGKGQNLINCYTRYNVPGGFCITKRLYDEILNNFLKEEGLVINPGEIEKVGERLAELRGFIKNYEFEEEFKKEVEKKIKELGCPTFAVRSSASSEDSLKSSFAGQFKTLLGIKKENILEAIKEILASAFTENVVLYTSESKLDYDGFYMALIIQKFLPSEKAGVLFSKNPSDPLKDGFWIEANFGVGESVVSGEVKPDKYFIDDFEAEVGVSEEKEAHSYIGDSKLAVEKKGRVLSNSEINQLVKLGKSLRDCYNKEIEYEWCFFDHNLHLLQVRPITTLKED